MEVILTKKVDIWLAFCSHMMHNATEYMLHRFRTISLFTPYVLFPEQTYTMLHKISVFCYIKGFLPIIPLFFPNSQQRSSSPYFLFLVVVKEIQNGFFEHQGSPNNVHIERSIYFLKPEVSNSGDIFFKRAK